jgi:Fe-S cluster biosynthesis and repair protein YggX
MLQHFYFLPGGLGMDSFQNSVLQMRWDSDDGTDQYLCKIRNMSSSHTFRLIFTSSVITQYLRTIEIKDYKLYPGMELEQKIWNVLCKQTSFPSTMSVHRYMNRMNDHFQNLLPRDILGNKHPYAGTGDNSD